MKIITSIVAAISCKEWQESDHWNGCIFPTSADQDLISNDPYAAFTLDAGGAVTGTANYQDGSEMGPVYSDGSLVRNSHYFTVFNSLLAEKTMRRILRR